MLDNLKNKKIGILGFGREGQSLLRVFAREGIAATVLDRDKELKFRDTRNLTSKSSPKVERRTNHSLSHVGEGWGEVGSVKRKLGIDYLKNLDRFDIIFRTPGIPRLIPELVEAERKGVEISSAIKLFFDLCPATIVGITGTKGKGTTAIFIYNILKAAGKNVYLAGNIGKPELDLLADIKKDSLVVLELSSFQLQDLHKSPHIAVVLGITSDHLDHHKTREEYVEAKGNILKYQKDGDFAVLDGDSKTVKKLAQDTKVKKHWFGKYEKVLGVKFAGLKLPGAHNIKNAKAAAITAQILGIENKIIQEALDKTPPRKHRLEFVKEHKGVKYFNDSASTIPESGIAAIRSFKEPKILILGGSEKNADYADLTQVIAEGNVRAVILIGETGLKIGNGLKKEGFGGEIIDMTDSRRFPSQREGSLLFEIVEKARGLAQKGDVVLLSPASASFSQFKNYEDRGEQFKEVVENL